MKTGLVIYNLRKERKWTQKDLASRLEVGRTTVNGYEKGIITPPPPIINKLSQIFGVSADYLIGNAFKSNVNTDVVDVLHEFKKIEKILNEKDGVFWGDIPLRNEQKLQVSKAVTFIMSFLSDTFQQNNN